MDLENKEDLYQTIRLLDGKKKLDQQALRTLCLVLAQSCTPYLGYHAKVEQAFEQFVASHEAKKTK